jgi:hypothetical protein
MKHLAMFMKGISPPSCKYIKTEILESKKTEFKRSSFGRE